MILRCLVITVTRNRKGQPIRNTQLVSGDPISIGRSPQSSVYLADPRVHLNHAIIKSNDLGKLYVEASQAPLDVDGELQDRAKLRRGKRILIGPYQITPEPPTNPNHDFGLAVEMVQPLNEVLGPLKARSRLTLGSTHLSKRGLSWALFTAVAVFMLALPLAYATSPRLSGESGSDLPGPLKNVAWTLAWNPGPLSQGHHKLTAQCQSCHEAPFKPVTDAACMGCHKNAGPHVRPASQLAGVSLDVRCASCHRDHRGENLSRRAGAEVCVNCHSNLRTRYAKSTLPNVSDFGLDHPAFAFSMVSATTGEVERVASTPEHPAREVSGLKFPHSVHVDRKGIRSPTGTRRLECANCHRKDEAKERFQPVKMTDACSECHRLEFEPSVTMRQAPHGDPALILVALREFYARIALGDRPLDVAVVNDLLRRPAQGGETTERTSALAWADRKAAAVATDLVESRVCVQCHEIKRSPLFAQTEPVWEVAPVKLTMSWLPGASFDHQSHQQSQCESCHDVRASKSSADVAIPRIEQCQTCHTGDKALPGKLQSPCQTCHSFHHERSALTARVARLDSKPPDRGAAR